MNEDDELMRVKGIGVLWIHDWGFASAFKGNVVDEGRKAESEGKIGEEN